ncbi:MAG: PAS domain S-box protein [Saprospiraceae bacterium]|nr:PAS domain S-box protein [Saprospiraceae bacterium]
MSDQEIAVLKRALQRERLARKKAESILEQKASELYDTSQELKKSNLALQSLLREKSSELKGVFENLVDAYVVMDLFGNVVKMNEAAEDLLGFRMEEEEVNLMSMAHPSEVDRVIQAFDKLMKEDSVANFEVRIKTLRGESKTVHINASLIRDEQHKPIAAQGIVRDITELMQLQKQKEELLESLGRSNEELSDYAHVVSHDLKSPLRSIDALVTWILDDNKETLDETTLANFDLIKQTLEKMEQLISGILEYASATSMDQKMLAVNVSDLIHGSIQMLHVPPGIQIEVDSGLPQVMCHPTKIQQVFQNLIGNAIKYMDSDAGQIHVGYQERDSHHEFFVKDNGPGIGQEHHQTVFKVFQSVSPKSSSSGVGLSIVKKVIEFHGGKVWLESVPDKGATFFFTLKKDL